MLFRVSSSFEQLADVWWWFSWRGTVVDWGKQMIYHLVFLGWISPAKLVFKQIVACQMFRSILPKEAKLLLFLCCIPCFVFLRVGYELLLLVIHKWKLQWLYSIKGQNHERIQNFSKKRHKQPQVPLVHSGSYWWQWSQRDINDHNRYI